jgi:hypothetical protein
LRRGFPHGASTKIVTAAEMDLMTPAERAAVVDAGIIRNLDDVPEPFRSRIIAKAHEIEAQRFG